MMLRNMMFILSPISRMASALHDMDLPCCHPPIPRRRSLASSDQRLKLTAVQRGGAHISPDPNKHGQHFPI